MPAVQAALDRLDKEFDVVFQWWPKLYDRASGGFYYSLGAKKSDKFKPDIEATCKAARVLEWTGVFHKTSSAFRQGLVRYMNSRQDKETGFYEDPQFDYTSNRRGRALGMATGVLDLCDAKPTYPLPHERVGTNKEASKHYAHLQSPAALRAWLADLPWKKRIWTVGSRIRTQSREFLRLQEPLRTQLLDELGQFLETKQGPDGMFQTSNESWRSTLSGTYKIASTLDINGRAIPNAREMQKTILGIFYGKQYDNVIVLYNTANILEVLNRQGAPMDASEQARMINRFAEMLHAFHAPGGGFVTALNRPTPGDSRYRVGPSIVEGNTDATGLAHKMRYILYGLVNGEKKPAGHPRAQDFLDGLP